MVKAEMTLAQLFALVKSCDSSLVTEPFFVSRRSEHTNGDGDVYHLFKDGSIYSFKLDETYWSLDSLKDVLVDDFASELGDRKTLDDVLELKRALDSQCSMMATEGKHPAGVN